MSKAIRWQIAFKAISGTSYRIDIYAEQDGTWSGVTQLLGGPQPFVTEEDRGQDFFTPVRAQTGNIQICTKLPSGGTVDPKDILPANNIDHPIQLVSISGNTETVEWQGFMSCEAFSQDYTSIPNILTIPIISVLEAMASVEVSTDYVNGLMEARYYLYYTLTEMDRKCGMLNPFFSNIYYSKGSANILTKYIDATILYSINEYTNEESFSYFVSGLSCKDVLARICTYMGWVCREQGKNIYFVRLGDEFALYTQPLSYLTNSFNIRATVNIVSANMAALDWHGKNNKRSVSQGAKSVEVVANIANYELNIELPEFPTDNMLHVISSLIESYIQMYTDFSNAISLHYYSLTVRSTGEYTYDLIVNGASDVDDAYAACALNPSCEITANYIRKVSGQTYTLNRPIGGFFAMLYFAGDMNEWINGLYLVAANSMQSQDNAPAIYKQDSIMNYRLVDGTLRLTISANTIIDDGIQLAGFMGIAYLKLKFGDLYWNGSEWNTTETTFAADFADSPVESDPGEYILEIPISSTQPLFGNIVIEILGSIKGGTQYPAQHGQPAYYKPFYDLFITELSLKYEEPEYVAANQRSENKYYRLLGTNFKDEHSISTDLASTLNNKPSPSLIMNDTTTAMRMMNYTLAGGGTEPRRPEVDLLNRMAAYYRESRQSVILKVKHPTVAALPLLQLNGIGDSKVYLPLAESRDWIEETSTLTCFELTNN